MLVSFWFFRSLKTRCHCNYVQTNCCAKNNSSHFQSYLFDTFCHSLACMVQLICNTIPITIPIHPVWIIWLFGHFCLFCFFALFKSDFRFFSLIFFFFCSENTIPLFISSFWSYSYSERVLIAYCFRSLSLTRASSCVFVISHSHCGAPFSLFRSEINNRKHDLELYSTVLNSAQRYERLIEYELRMAHVLWIIWLFWYFCWINTVDQFLDIPKRVWCKQAWVRHKWSLTRNIFLDYN